MNDNEHWHDEHSWDNQGSDNQGERHDNDWDQGQDHGSPEHAPDGQDTSPQESGEQSEEHGSSEHLESHDSPESEEGHSEADHQSSGEGYVEHARADAAVEGEQIGSEQADSPDAGDLLGVSSADADEVVMTTVTRARAALSRPTTAYSRMNAMIRRRDRKSRVRILIEEFQVEEVDAHLRLSVRRPRLRFPAVDVIATSRAVADRAVAPTRAARLRATQEAHLLRAAAVSRVELGRGQAVARMSAVQAQAAAAGHVGRVKAQGLVNDGLGAAIHRATDPVASALVRLRGRLGALGRDSGRNRLPHVELPHMELPHVELPKLELPKVDLPKLDLPKVDKATLSQPLVDLRAEIRDEFRGFAHEADKVANTASEALGRAKRVVRR